MFSRFYSKRVSLERINNRPEHTGSVLSAPAPRPSRRRVPGVTAALALFAVTFQVLCEPLSWEGAAHQGAGEEPGIRSPALAGMLFQVPSTLP